MIENIIQITNRIYTERFSGAKVIFLAGSIIRGEGTRFSDLDLVVLYQQVRNAYRESFTYEGYPVEAFIHDSETLNYFFCEVDRPQGTCTLATMVAEGIEILNPSEYSASLKQLAQSVIDMGPVEFTADEIDRLRYQITGLIDDIREPRNLREMTGTCTELYPLLANFYLRTKDLWGAEGKVIPRMLKRYDASFYEAFTSAFEKVFVDNEQEHLIKLAENILNPYGGFLFDNYKLVAPENFRKSLT